MNEAFFYPKADWLFSERFGKVRVVQCFMDKVQIPSFKEQNANADKKSAIDLFMVKCFLPSGCANYHMVFKRWENGSLKKSSPLTSVYLRPLEADISPVKWEFVKLRGL